MERCHRCAHWGAREEVPTAPLRRLGPNGPEKRCPRGSYRYQQGTFSHEGAAKVPTAGTFSRAHAPKWEVPTVPIELRRRYKRRSARGRTIGCTRAFGPARSPRALFGHQKKGALAPENGALFSGVFPVLATRALFGERQMCPRSAHCQSHWSAPPSPADAGTFSAIPGRPTN